ncbi:TetR/AcrR family transcriptional regulator [Limnobacter litoralis]|uniref:HTH tetR-type domain-containing protein n=1 Tax=Limnobacter litoralis TaxID=481366 RepID=A0ABQ5YLS1_9BURK|nr:TetR/AcrR family transcriptional regulator [Limnobacter litoralis]GLR25064.1 hypothetical protein GCM10007875_01510 [Limnobacter litoralis]
MSNRDSKSRKRSYLDKQERRQFLIENAAVLVEQKGWAVLNMSALATSAKVSRQLVYQHFPSLDALLVETASFIFFEVMNESRLAVEKNSGNLRDAIKCAAAVSLDLPKGRGNALWQLIAGMNYGSRELEQLRLQIRDFILGLWMTTFFDRNTANSDSLRSLVWMLIMSFWGLRQMIWDGLIGREHAMRELDRIVDALLPGVPVA